MRIASLALIIVLVTQSGCQSDGHVAADPTPTEPHTDARTSLVMKQKLDFSSSILGSLAAGDFDGIVRSADRLSSISEQSDWFVHDTVEYTAFSGQFRETTFALASAARARDWESSANAYEAMTASCIECHRYMRDSGLSRGMPGELALEPIRTPSASAGRMEGELAMSGK